MKLEAITSCIETLDRDYSVFESSLLDKYALEVQWLQHLAVV